MLDLPTLGRELRVRRRALRIPSAELARKIGVSPTYIWLIEHAKPRQSGEPSRLSEDLLRRWTSALGMTGPDTQRIRELAGYFGSDVQYERGTAPRAPVSTSVHSPSPLYSSQAPNDAEPELEQGNQRERYDRATDMAALHRWAGTEAPDNGDEAIAERVRDVFQRADQNGRHDEARSLLNSFLAWLEFHIDPG